jgi:hypothetical protein
MGMLRATIHGGTGAIAGMADIVMVDIAMVDIAATTADCMIPLRVNIRRGNL